MKLKDVFFAALIPIFSVINTVTYTLPASAASYGALVYSYQITYDTYIRDSAHAELYLQYYSTEPGMTSQLHALLQKTYSDEISSSAQPTVNETLGNDVYNLDVATGLSKAQIYDVQHLGINQQLLNQHSWLNLDHNLQLLRNAALPQYQNIPCLEVNATVMQNDLRHNASGSTLATDESFIQRNIFDYATGTESLQSCRA